MNVEKYRNDVQESAKQWLSEIDHDEFSKEFISLESENYPSPKLSLDRDLFGLNEQ